jgi:hypothetical protein
VKQAKPMYIPLPNYDLSDVYKQTMQTLHAIYASLEVLLNSYPRKAVPSMARNNRTWLINH